VFFASCLNNISLSVRGKSKATHHGDHFPRGLTGVPMTFESADSYLSLGLLPAVMVKRTAQSNDWVAAMLSTQEESRFCGVVL
jgi:hypothetical protein